MPDGIPEAGGQPAHELVVDMQDQLSVILNAVHLMPDGDAVAAARARQVVARQVARLFCLLDDLKNVLRDLQDGSKGAAHDPGPGGPGV